MMSQGNTLSEATVGVLQHSSRYIHVNTQPYWLGHPSHQSESGDGGNKTIEWRLHSASLNPTKIHNWARIIRGMTMHTGQFKVDADEWAAQPLSPEKVGAFLKGIEQDDLFDYVMQRVIKFEKKDPQRGSQLEMTYDIGKMEGSILGWQAKSLPSKRARLKAVRRMKTASTSGIMKPANLAGPCVITVLTPQVRPVVTDANIATHVARHSKLASTVKSIIRKAADVRTVWGDCTSR